MAFATELSLCVQGLSHHALSLPLCHSVALTHTIRYIVGANWMEIRKNEWSFYVIYVVFTPKNISSSIDGVNGESGFFAIPTTVRHAHRRTHTHLSMLNVLANVTYVSTVDQNRSNDISHEFNYKKRAGNIFIRISPTNYRTWPP